MILFLEQVEIIIHKYFLEECNYVVKEKKIPKYIIDNIEISSDSDKENSAEDNSDEDNSDEENSDEEILEKIQITGNFDEEDSSEEDSDEKKINFVCVYKY